MKIARIVTSGLSAGLFFALPIIGVTTVDTEYFIHMMIIGITMCVATALLAAGLNKGAGIVTLVSGGLWFLFGVIGMTDGNIFYLAISRYSYGGSDLEVFNFFYVFVMLAGFILVGLSMLIPKMKWASLGISSVFLIFVILNYSIDGLYFYHRSYGFIYDALEADLNYGHFWTVFVMCLAYITLSLGALFSQMCQQKQNPTYGMYAPQYPQAPYGQPQYPQAPYGQPQYPQQAPYGQPQYPQQAPYGQPQYPQQAPYGQPQYPQQAPYGQPQYPQAPYGQPQYPQQEPNQYL